MDLIQSFIYSTGRVKLSLYEQRIMIKIVEHAQSAVKGMVIKNNLEQWSHDFDNVVMSVKCTDILDEGNTHYEHVENAMTSLMSRIVEFRSSYDNSWFSSPIICDARHAGGSGMVTFRVPRQIFDVILDFSKGFRKYDLDIALSLSSPYAARMYALMAGQKRPLRYEIDELKKMFGVADKYSQTADFIKKVIDPAERTLADLNVNGFKYSRIKHGLKVKALLLTPVIRQDESKKSLLAKASSIYIMPKEIQVLLMQWAGFTIKELNAHKQLLDDFCHIPGCYQLCMEIVNRAKSRGKEKGYIIQGMRGEVDEFSKR